MWLQDPLKNKDADPSSEEYIFRPCGFQPGHSFEWAKLILLIERHCAAQGPGEEAGAGSTGVAWMVPTARLLFDTAIMHGWDDTPGSGGAFYTYSVDGEGKGKVLDTNKYYWALAEMIAAAGLLAARSGATPDGEGDDAQQVGH